MGIRGRNQAIVAGVGALLGSGVLFVGTAGAALSPIPDRGPTGPAAPVPMASPMQNAVPVDVAQYVGDGQAATPTFVIEIALVARPIAVVPEPSPIALEPSDDRLAALRACESGGDYRAVSAGGLYRGAYQFDQRTWNVVASRHYPELAGVDPAQASPAQQDAMARALHAERGWAPWPTCGRGL